MMRRLREEIRSPDSTIARAAALIAAMRPLDVAALRRRPLPPVLAPSRNAARIRVALSLAVSFGSVAAAAATWHGAIGWGRPAAEAQSKEAAPIGPQLTARDFERPLVNATTDGPPVADSAGDMSSAAPLTNRRAPSMQARSTPKGPSRDVDAARETESAMIVDGVRTLRRDGDAARAEQLAEEALRRYPHGLQVEEAMALAMEAESARGDAQGARHAAQRYLQSFGSGRFADRAERILAAPPR
jgi:hypothetical protein